ncbi:hypothetical protein KP77_25290 [Jeotgalibacillus alimentarius]|uniref:Uncharacterized protein n=1 Tax=Jeotgalibacillus alimentarius TaxID=135826 RepID=A0A0C2R9F7_9BACL|nr:hypothetical protein [Jeotgalibacillus alimentarius]KIL46960.1 hypothetical protein KP77_25290 [Jeotgalibacillus alimentarius]
MQHITKGKDLLGEEIALMMGEDCVYVAQPNNKDEECNSKVSIIPKELFIEFAKKVL